MKLRRQRIPVLGLALLLGTAGCNITESYRLGSLSAQVLNQNNAGVQGLLLDLYKIEGGTPIYWRASATSSNGVGVFGERDGGVVEGDYFIRVVLTPSYDLAPGETNDRPVTVREGDDITVTFRLVPKTVG